MKERERQQAAKNSAKEQTAKKKLSEMNLLDDFLFGSVVTYPEIGERFVRILLKTIFGKEFKQLSIAAQKVYYGADSDLHGTRLDVYVEPEIEEGSAGRATVYDMEPDRKNSSADIRALPRRMRFYHARIAARNLKSGTGYDELKNVIIIMIMPYDPFGLKRMIYTVKNMCVEVPEMEYEDGASTIFLYTGGTEGVTNEAVKQLLYYMEHTDCNNAVNNDLREIHRMIETVKRDPEMTIRYLRLMEELDRSRAEGKKYTIVSQICKKMKKNKTIEEIAEDLEEEISVVEPIYTTAKSFAPEYDPDLVFERLNAVE